VVDRILGRLSLTARQTFLRKLKFQYLEQNAKMRYIKQIVNEPEDVMVVSQEDLQALSASNEEKKAQLKVAKEGLAELQDNIRKLSPLVEQGEWQLCCDRALAHGL